MLSNIIDYPYTNKLFGSVINRMKHTSLYFLIENDRDIYLDTLEIILEKLFNNSNVEELIQHYKRKQLNDNERFDSLLSEIRAGFQILNEGFPIEFLEIKKSKTPDIKTVIDRKTAYIEVKRVTEKHVEWREIKQALKDEQIDYDILFAVNSKIIQAKQFAKKLKARIPKDITDDFNLINDDFINFGPGQFKIRNKKGKEPVYNLAWCSYTVRDTKKELLEKGDGYYSKENYEDTISEHIESKAIPQLMNISKESDLRFVFLDNIDVANYDHSYLKLFLYDGGRDKQEQGWYYYYELVKHLDGIFHILNYDYLIGPVYCFLNPINENYSRLSEVIKCSER